MVDCERRARAPPGKPRRMVNDRQKI
jgi:hypothetical protein